MIFMQYLSLSWFLRSVQVTSWLLHSIHVAIWFLKVDMPILTCIFFTFNWLTLTSEMHFVKLHPEVASCLLSWGKRKYAPLGMRLLWKYIRNYFLVYQLISCFLLYIQKYKEFEAEILDLQSEKYGLSSRGGHSPHDWLRTRVHKKRRKGSFFGQTTSSTSFAKRVYFSLSSSPFRVENGNGKQRFEKCSRVAY